MKKVFITLSMVALILAGCYKDDINDLKSKYDSLQTVLSALQKQLTVSNVENISGGYKIVFSDGSTAELTQGKDGQDAPSIVDITMQDGNVLFLFSNGSTITLPLTNNFSYYLSGAAVQCFQYSEHKEFSITQSGVQNITITKPDGWRATVQEGILTVTAPPVENIFAEQSGLLTILAMGNHESALVTLELHVRDYNYLVDFEGSGILDYLAGPTSYGENLYSSFGPAQYIGYEDAESGLCFMINEDDPYGLGMSREFWNGGIAISQWNDMTTDGFLNQCSVFFSDPATRFGGYNGSHTFAVNNNSGEISFKDAAQEGLFDHFWVTNTTYTALSMLNGDPYAKKFEAGDWFKLIINAYDRDGAPTGTPVEFYLADFRSATSPGVVTEWTLVDLTPLGSHVHKVVFDFDSSDSGEWGINTPTYFCFDHLAIKK